MKVRIKSKRPCQVPGCKRAAVCGSHPKGHIEKTIHVCEKHADDDILWDIWKLRKPEKIVRPKAAVENHKPKREGKPKWQETLDKWFAKGMFPVSNFMNPKRWEYWISIGGQKPNGDSRKFSKKKSQRKKEELVVDEIHPLLLHKMTKHKGSRSIRTKVRRKKSY